MRKYEEGGDVVDETGMSFGTIKRNTETGELYDTEGSFKPVPKSMPVTETKAKTEPKKESKKETNEESKAESSDRISTVYEAETLNYEHLVEILAKARTKAELDEENVLTVRVSGVQVPVNIKINKKHQTDYFLINK